MVCTVTMNLLPDKFADIRELADSVRPIANSEERRLLLEGRLRDELNNFLDDDSKSGQGIEAADVVEAMLGVLINNHVITRTAALKLVLEHLDRKYERLGGFEPGVVFDA